jgi:glycerol-3-phosphate acyltransferase PlsX
MSRKVTVALDAMGGDNGAAVVVPAALATLARDDSVNLILVGRDDVLEAARREAGDTYGSRLTFKAASEVVGMDEPPAEALRKKKDSSIRVAMNLVKSGAADAAVSAGNTGALMATAKYVLKTLPGIDRPAIIAAVPGLSSRTFMLDLGANVGCSAQHLVQFGVMGSVVAADILDKENPRIGLLNIGAEAMKGHDVIREAGELLAASPLNYIGFVEGDDIFFGDVDVVVSDGFSGNVSLKTMEGLARLIRQFLKEEFTRNPIRRLQGMVALPALKSIRARLDSRRYNGASLVGLNGIVIKSHGGADQMAFGVAIGTAVVEARKGLPVQIGQLLDSEAFACTRE